jgi:heme/copper-type cytochrome/quinol oxidase subunit 2
MLLHLFAGPVISNELYYTIIFVSLIVIIAVLTLVIFILRKLTSSKKSLKNRKTFAKSFLISSMIILSVILIFFVIPTVIKDIQWARKQSDCAKKSGYTSPGDDNNPIIATYYSQSTYEKCLDN